MNYHTLNKFESREIALVEVFNQKSYDEEFFYLKDFFEEIKYWDLKLSSINNILSVVLEQIEKRGIDSRNIIHFLYNLSENTSFYIQETEIQFIDELYKNILHGDLELDDYLINTQNEILRRL